MRIVVLLYAIYTQFSYIYKNAWAYWYLQSIPEEMSSIEKRDMLSWQVSLTCNFNIQAWITIASYPQTREGRMHRGPKHRLLIRIRAGNIVLPISVDEMLRHKTEQDFGLNSAPSNCELHNFGCAKYICASLAHSHAHTEHIHVYLPA